MYLEEISNSSANSEESNDEAFLTSSAENIRKFDDLKSDSLKESNFKEKIVESETTICPTSTETITNDNTIDNDEAKNKNIVHNFRKFFANRFSTKKNELKPQLSLGTNIMDQKEKRSFSSSSSNWLSSRLTQKYSFDSNKKSKPILLTRQENIDSSLVNLSSSIERYKQIIEDHKDLLPKNFTIRQFPYSSCQDTFDDEDTDINGEHLSSEAQLPNDEIKSTDLKESNKISLKSTNENSGNKENLITTNEQEMSNKNILAIQNEDHVNADLHLDFTNKNKRYYHVFKEHELNELVKESCPSLKIYESYYDHGNWVICAEKQTK